MRFLTEEGLSVVIFRHCNCLLASLIFVFAPSLGAQELNATESDFFDDAPLILTASRMSKPLAESPSSVSVITRKMIEASGAREISDIFRLAPGFIVGNYSGNNPVVTYNGLGEDLGKRLQVLIDGRSVFVPSFGGVRLANLPLILEDIERVEIIRGPNAVTYGANAFLATINIITRHAAEDIGVKYSLTTSGGGNPEADDAYIRLGYHHENLDWRISLGTLNDNGFESVNDSRESDKLNFRLDYVAQQNQFWTVQMGSSETVRGLERFNTPITINRDESATNSYLNIHWEQVLSSSTSSARLTHTVQDVVDNFDIGRITLLGPVEYPRIIDFDRISTRTDFELIQTEELDKSLRLAYGTSLRHDRIKSIFLFADQKYHEVDTTRLFASVEWRFAERWILDIGTTFEDTSITEREVSPRLSILHNFKPDHMLRFVASHAKRNPVLFEHSGENNLILPANGVVPDIRFPVAAGNPDIQPEDIASYEIGLRSQFNNAKITSDIKFFTYEITDNITGSKVEETIPVFGVVEVETATNSDETRVSGIEFSIDYTASPDFMLRSGFSFIDAESTESDFTDSIPDWSAFVLSQYQFGNRHTVSGALYYIDDMIWLDTQDRTSSINKLDLRYRYLIDKDSETYIELIGQNMLEEYTDYLSENLQERTYLLRISGGF